VGAVQGRDLRRLLHTKVGDELQSGCVKRTAFMDSATQSTASLNLGHVAEVTIGELADLRRGMMRWQSELEYLPLAKDDPREHQLDITSASRRHQAGLVDADD
jgi:hypothetical protein